MSTLSLEHQVHLFPEQFQVLEMCFRVRHCHSEVRYDFLSIAMCGGFTCESGLTVVKVGIDTALSGLSVNIDNINAGYSPNGNMTAISLMHVSGTGGPPKCLSLVSFFYSCQGNLIGWL